MGALVKIELPLQSRKNPSETMVALVDTSLLTHKRYATLFGRESGKSYIKALQDLNVKEDGSVDMIGIAQVVFASFAQTEFKDFDDFLSAVDNNSIIPITESVIRVIASASPISQKNS